MVVEICVGSSCFLRGSEEVVKNLQRLIETRCPGKVTVKGSFCMGKCTEGVTIKINDQYFSGIRPCDVEEFFQKNILPCINS